MPGGFTHDENSRSEARAGPLLCWFFGLCGGRDADAVGRNRPARGSAVADQSGRGAGGDTRLRRADDRSPRRRWSWRWRPWRWGAWWRGRWISRRWRWLPWWRCRVSRRRFPRRWRHVPWRRLSRRPCFPRRRLPPRRVRVSAPPLSSALLRVLLRLPVLLFVPPLPGDLDLLWPAQDLPLPPLASPPVLASSPLLASPSS